MFLNKTWKYHFKLIAEKERPIYFYSEVLKHIYSFTGVVLLTTDTSYSQNTHSKYKMYFNQYIS